MAPGLASLVFPLALVLAGLALAILFRPLAPTLTNFAPALPPLAGAAREHASPATALDATAAGGHRATGVGGHEASEGFALAARGHGAAVSVSAGCAADSRVRAYDVVAIGVDITINRYLDHDPRGRIYVLAEDLGRVRDEEQRNARARRDGGEPAVSLGLQGDAIQPLTLRVNQGECLRIRLRNAYVELAGIHVHGAGLRVGDDGSPAIGTNPRALVPPGGSVTYEWAMSEDEPEGTHYFHSPGDDRFQTGHGLFGAVIVEPRGSVHLDPATGRELRSGWSAVIRTPDGKSFREAVLYYHEVGNETYQFLDRAGNLVPLVDPITSAYRPGARALNYRSEPFMNRLQLQRATTGSADESVSYGSYTFGDPATPIIRSYLGDPLKQRVVHGGSEVFHVHHVHGGSIRWRRQPGAEPTGLDRGLDKSPPLLPSVSERIDSQAIGPSEAYDVENECGAGGCQQSVGDYLIHCHVAHHYFAGMWGLWRVYNTLQDGRASTDALPPLLELPDRVGGVLPAVTSAQLIGRTVDWYGTRQDIGAADLGSWVERQLPPRGVPRGYDASVLDWRREGDLYLGEVEDARSWPGFRSALGPARPPLLFDPRTGKLAFPFLRPHLGKRPPFAPNHGPAPYLDPISNGVDPPAPGANGIASVCPAGTHLREFAVNAISTPVTLNRAQRLIDPAGQLFALREELPGVRADERRRVPLTIRANAREDCVDILFRSDLEDTPDDKDFSKVNLHIHLVQFDVQASDGVIAGFNYEQSVRPYRLAGEQVIEPAPAGATRLRLSGTARFQRGILVGVGMDQDQRLEIARVLAVQDDYLIFAAPLRNAHVGGEFVSAEFVRYRWYPDAQVGTAYFHDHVNALVSWRRGLFGALVVEPPGSTYHDPYSGREVRSGTAVDVVTTGTVSADVRGSFREFALFPQDDNPITHVGRSSGSAINLRAEPLAERGGDPARLFSSQGHGDPATPLLEAYLGDPVVVRLLVGATNDVHTFHLDGHQFRAEPFSATSPPVSTVHVGISERYDLSIPRAGGVAGMLGDYLYYSGRASKLAEGSWGILRVHHAETRTALRTLPGRANVPTAAPSICPTAAPQKRFALSVIEVPLPMLGGAMGRVYALRDDAATLRSGARPPEPLVLHVGVGDCIAIELTNELASDSVSFHADMLATDPRTSSGVTAGRNEAQTVAPGATRTFTYYAHPATGETVALVRDWGNVLKSPRLGLYGAIVVGPAGARYTDPRSGEDAGARSSWSVVVHPPTGAPYRDFALFLQEDDATIGTHRMPYTEQVEGVVGLNYRAEPLRDRGAKEDGDGAAFRPARGVPATPLLEAIAGDAVRIRVLLPWAEQAHVFSVEGHRWPLEPGLRGGDLLSSVQVGGLEAVTLRLEGGAGSGLGMTGDFLYGDHRLPYRDAGLWGLFRVHPPCATGAPPPLVADPRCGSPLALAPLVPWALALATLLLAATAVALARRRRQLAT